MIRRVPALLVNLFPWFVPLALALLAGKWLDRKYVPRPRVDAASSVS